jgi:hypothetical protein
LVALAMALGTTAVIAPAAQAAEYVTGEWGAYKGASTFWGNLTVGGVYGLCIDPGTQPPNSLGPGNATKVCGSVKDGQPDKTAQIAYLLARHLRDTDTKTLVSLSQFGRGEYHDSIPVTYPSRYAELVAEAKQAGPKDAYVQVDLDAGKVWVGIVSGGEAAKLVSGGLKRADAHFVAGYSAKVEITSPNATFTDGSTSKTVETRGDAISLDIRAAHDLIANEKVTVAVEIADVPQPCFMMHEESNSQRVLTPLFATLTGKHTATADQTPWTPLVSSEVTTPAPNKLGTVADKVKAVVTSGSWPVTQWADAAQTKPQTYAPMVAAGQIIRADRPTAPSASVPAGTAVLPGRATATLAGPGVWETASITLPASAGAGYYSIRWCLDRADQGDNAKYLAAGGPWCDDYFSATELFQLPMTLGISTKAPNQVVAKGETADDTVTLYLPDQADNWMTDRDGKPVTVKAHGTLYGSSLPFAEQSAPPATAAKLGETDINITLPTSGREPVRVPAPAGFNLQGATHWTWVWEVRLADQPAPVAALLTGDAKDSFGKADESGYVPMTLDIASKLPNQYRAKGEAPDDTITVSLPNPADQWIALPSGNPAIVRVDGVYYAGSASSFTISDQPPPDAKALGAATVNVTLPTSGRNPVTVAAPAGFTVPTSQYGTWVWQIKRADQAPEVAVLFDNDPADKFGQQLETHVTQMELAIESQVAEATVTEPKGDGTAQVCDVVWVEHTSPADLWLNQWGTDKPVEVKVGGNLYRSAVPGPQTTSIDKNLPVVDSYELVFTAAGKDNAQKVCHTVGYGDYGAYGFVFGIDLSEQPDATKDYLAKGTTTPLWLPAETTIVRRAPVIHTAATRWTATNDGREQVFFTDEIWQIDWPEAPADTDLYGAVEHGAWPGYSEWQADGKTVKVELWRVEGEVTPESCTADNSDAKLIAVNESTPALNTWGASQKVSGSKFTAEGGDATYTFVVTWLGDSRTEPYKSVCGEKSETITLIRTAPEFITQLLAPADLKGASPATAAAREQGIEAEAGTELMDVLHAMFPTDAQQADMTGWTATWDTYYQPTAEPLPIGDGDMGKVYQGASCTPENLLASSGDPVPVEKEGDYLSPTITVPGEPGMVFTVETVTDREGQVVRRGECGAASESAIVLPPPEQPKPRITTNAPERANTGDKIKDEAILTGPYPKGTQVEFLYQHTPYTNPAADRDDLKCDAPDPASVEGAVKIGITVLDRDLAEGVTEKLYSPEFTSDKEGCTWIKEIAYASGDGPNRESLAEGYFGATNERTMWHETPPAPPIGELPRTGAGVAPWIAAGAGLLIIGGMSLVALVYRRRKLAD